MEKKLKILAHRADSDGCGWHRIMIPGSHLNNLGLAECKHTTKVIQENIDAHDVIIFQRSNQPQFLPIFEKLANDPNKLLVYEADDAFDLIPSDSYAHQFFGPSVLKNMDDLMKACDVLQLSTPFLCDHYGKKTGKETFLVPNQISRTFPHQHHGTEKVIVGWAGGASHNVDFGLLKKALKQIEKEFPQVVFRIMGASNVYAMLRRQGLSNLEYVDWSKDLTVYYEELAKFDIGLAPVIECGFNKAKSTLKFLEYAACGTPMVGSKFLYEQDAVHGETAMLAERPLQWYEMIKELIVDAEKRRAMGDAAQTYIAAERLHDQHVPKRIAFYQDALERKRKRLLG